MVYFSRHMVFGEVVKISYIFGISSINYHVNDSSLINPILRNSKPFQEFSNIQSTASVAPKRFLQAEFSEQNFIRRKN